MSSSRKELFVLGAGASQASGGTPLGRELVWEYYEDCHGLYQIREGGKTDPREVEEIGREYESFGKFLEYIDSLVPGLLLRDKWHKVIRNAETFVPKVNKQYYIDEICQELFQRKEYQTIALIRRLVTEHITKAARGYHNSLYEEFGEYLSRSYTPDNVSIISFNFDCLLCEDYVKRRIFYDYLIKFDDIYEDAKKYRPDVRGIPLIKLHGSLDWGWDSSLEKIVQLFPYVSHETYKRNGLEPFIFLPHQQLHGILDQLWKRAALEIQSAHKITIIGYSFPEYDTKVRELFTQNSFHGPEVEVVDHCEAISPKTLLTSEKRRKFEAIFPESQNICVNLDGFKVYVDNLKAVN